MRAKLIEVGLVGVITLACGCGGGGARLTVREYVSKTSAVCAQGNREIGRVELSNVRRTMGRVVVIHRRSVDELRGLRPPKRFEGRAEAWVALVDQMLDEIDAMRAAMHDGDRQAVSAYAEKAAVLDRRSRLVAREHGITPCRVPLGLTA